MEYIIDVEEIIKFYISPLSIENENGKEIPVTYSWGDQHALLQFMRAKDKEKQALQAIGENANKYPLIWQTPTKYEVFGKSEIIARNFTLIFAQNTRANWLNETRWNNTLRFLRKVANEAISILEQTQQLRIEMKNGARQLSWEEVANYSSDEGQKNYALEIWDAVVVKMNLIINKNCLKKIRATPIAEKCNDINQ